jgi:hypothetical protein
MYQQELVPAQGCGDCVAQEPDTQDPKLPHKNLM